MESSGKKEVSADSSEQDDTPDAKSAFSLGVKKFTTFFKNFLCLLIWLWLISRVIGFPFPGADYIAPILKTISASLSSTIIELVVLVSIIIIVIFKAYWKVAKFLFFFWLRFLFFPFLLLYYLLLYPFKLISFSLKAINAFLDNVIRTTVLKSIIFLVILLPVSFLISVNSVAAPWLIISIIGSSISVLIVLRIAFLWTAKPLMFIQGIVNVSSKLLDKYVEHISKQPSTQDDKTGKSKEKDSFRDQLDLVYKGLDWVQGFVERSTDQRVIVKIFLFLFSGGFLISVVSFGIIYFALNKVHPGSFQDASSGGILSFIYSSLLVITTSGQIRAETDLARIAISSEILYGVSLLTLLIFQFSMISIPQVLSKKNDVINVLISKKDRIREEESRRSRINEATPVDSIDLPPESKEGSGQ